MPFFIGAVIAAIAGAGAYGAAKKAGRAADKAANGLMSAGQSVERAADTAVDIMNTAGRFIDQDATKVLHQLEKTLQNMQSFINTGHALYPSLTELIKKTQKTADCASAGLQLTTEKLSGLFDEVRGFCQELRKQLPTFSAKLHEQIEVGLNTLTRLVDSSIELVDKIVEATNVVKQRVQFSTAKFSHDSDCFKKMAANSIEKAHSQLASAADNVAKNADKWGKLAEQGQEIGALFAQGLYSMAIFGMIISIHHMVLQTAKGEDIFNEQLLLKLQIAALIGFFLPLAAKVMQERVMAKLPNVENINFFRRNKSQTLTVNSETLRIEPSSADQICIGNTLFAPKQDEARKNAASLSEPYSNIGLNMRTGKIVKIP